MLAVSRTLVQLLSLSLIVAIRVVKKRGSELEDDEAHEFGCTENCMKKFLLPEDPPGGFCMDGSQAGYFYRPGTDTMNTTWVLYLQGGGGCSDLQGCEDWMNKPRGHCLQGCKGSSSGWEDTKKGVNSCLPDEEDNPAFFKAHHVYVPYCTGDGHAGRIGVKDDSNEFGPYYFDGHLNLNKILRHLAQETSFLQMEKMLFQGQSAGGIGVFRNCDAVGQWAKKNIGKKAQVKCNPVAGFYVAGFTEDQGNPTLPPTPYEQHAAGLAAPPPSEFDPKAPQDPYYPPHCVEALPAGTAPWSCGSATWLYQTMKQPMFITQDMFDYSQIGGGGGMNKNEVGTCPGNEYISYSGKAMKNTTTQMVSKKKSDGLFLTSCYEHGNYPIATIDGINRVAALASWWNADGTVPRVMADTCQEGNGFMPCGAGGPQGCPHIQPCE